MGSAPTAPSGQAGNFDLAGAVTKRMQGKTTGTPLISQGAPRNTDAVPPATALTSGLNTSPFGPTGQKKTALGT